MSRRAAARDFLRQRLRGLLRDEASPRAAYLAMSELLRRHAREGGPASESGTLTGHELRVFSQNGEDGVIAELIARCGAPSRFFVEFGAGDGHENNCAVLADLLGWSGVFIEGDPDLYSALDAKYRPIDAVRTVNAMISADNAEDVFARAGVPPEPDLLSIDVDGADLWIWRALRSHRPRLVVIEYNSALDPDRPLVQPPDLSGAWDGTDYYGASIGALRALADEKGYRLVHTDLTGTNAFFVREDVAGDLPTDVPVRGPNHFLAGGGHRPDPHLRPYRTYP
jgi:hypothetical protein